MAVRAASFRRQAMKYSGWLAKLLFTAPLIMLPVYGQGQRYDSAPGRDKAMNAPASSPLNAAKVAMGKRLFFDTRLSADEWLSCSSCHDPGHAFSETRAVSVGVLGQRGKRHAPTLLGRGAGRS